MLDRISEDPDVKRAYETGLKMRRRAAKAAYDKRLRQNPEFRAKERARKRERQRERWATDEDYRQRMLANNKRLRDRDPARFARAARASSRRLKYGISVEAFEAMFRAQGGRCSICQSAFEMTSGNKEKGKSAHVDHDHVTGRVRGLLCSRCNVGLGQFRDSPELLHAAVAYLGRST